MTDENKPAWAPGPWRVYSANGKRSVTIRGGTSEPGYSVASVSAGLHREANAALIAAAPDLYEALDDAINYLAVYARWRLGDENAKEILDKCTTALTRAHGEQP